MHLKIESRDKLALLAVIGGLLDAPLPPDWAVQAGFGMEDGVYWFHADYSSPEKATT